MFEITAYITISFIVMGIMTTIEQIDNIIYIAVPTAVSG